jgi:hypothetical protein
VGHFGAVQRSGRHLRTSERGRRLRVFAELRVRLPDAVERLGVLGLNGQHLRGKGEADTPRSWCVWGEGGREHIGA